MLYQKIGSYFNEISSIPCRILKNRLILDFTSKLVHRLTFRRPRFGIAPYDKINHALVYLSSKCDVKSGLRSPPLRQYSTVGKLRGSSLCF